MAALGEVVVGLAGYFGGGIGCERAVLGSGARREGFGAEFGFGVVAYEAAGLVLEEKLTERIILWD